MPYSNSWMALAITFAMLVLLQMLPTRIVSLPMADKITSLPNQPGIAGFQQFSGYITIDEKQGRALFYYFVEAKTQPASKPLVLWFNGGPGCSSVGAGAFVEHGPFKVNGKTLVKNEYSWNTEANIIYLESPAGVGFSYSANKSFYSYIDDVITARDNLVFLQRWFDNFPEYKNRDFYIAGESYAGHYVPQLAELIIKSKLNFKLKGIAIGNPLVEFATDFNSRGDYLWSHGVISDSTYKLLNSMCNYSRLIAEALDGSFSPDCQFVAIEFFKEMSQFLDDYYVIGDVCQSNATSQTGFFNDPLRSLLFDTLSTSGLHTDSRVHRNDQVSCKSQESYGERDLCSQLNTVIYLNRKDVQQSLHAKLVGIPEWNLCNGNKEWHYNPKNRLIPTIGIVGSLVKYNLRVLVYSGDQDSVIPFIGTRTLVNLLAKNLGLNTTVPYKAWLVDQQIGGWTQVYGNYLSFATIRGASHTAPEIKPKASLVLFKSFLTGKPLVQV